MNKDILAIITAASEMGANAALRRMAPAADRISQRQAVAEYGIAFLRDNADRLTVTRNGNRKEYSRARAGQGCEERGDAGPENRMQPNQIKDKNGQEETL